MPGQDEQSNQERLVRVFSEFAYGEQCIFAPQIWYVGSGQREPADLVWSNNGCVMLMNMEHMTVPPSTPARAERRRDEGIAKNIRQIKGGLRLWRTGRLLEGANNHSAFSLVYNDQTPIIVLSLAEYGCSIAKYHHAETADLDVAICASVPFSVLERFGEMHAGIVDLIHLLVHLSDEPNSLDEQQAHALVDQYVMNSWIRSGTMGVWPGHAPERYSAGIYADAALRLYSARTAPRPDGTGNWIAFGPTGTPATGDATNGLADVASVLGDLRLADYVRLWTLLNLCLDRALGEQDMPPGAPRPVPGLRTPVDLPVKLTDYDIMLHITPTLFVPDAELDHVRQRAEAASRHRDAYLGPQFVVTLDGHTMMFAPPRPFPSLTERLLTEWKAAQDTPQRDVILETVRPMFSALAEPADATTSQAAPPTQSGTSG